MHVCVENANGTSSVIQYVGVTIDKNQTLQPLNKLVIYSDNVCSMNVI